MVRKLNLEEKRGWAKPASASGDTQRRRRNVSITSGKSPAGRQRSGKVVNKVGKSALASGDEHAARLRRPAACQASDSPVSASGDRAITSVFLPWRASSVLCCEKARIEGCDSGPAFFEEWVGSG